MTGQKAMGWPYVIDFANYKWPNGPRLTDRTGHDNKKTLHEHSMTRP